MLRTCTGNENVNYSGTLIIQTKMGKGCLDNQKYLNSHTWVQNHKHIDYTLCSMVLPQTAVWKIIQSVQISKFVQISESNSLSNKRLG